MTALQEWLRQASTGNPVAEPVISEEENELHGLSLRDVLQAHKDWRTQLEMDAESERLRQVDVATISRDDQCTLGKWLHGPGRQRFGTQAAWLAACQAHSEFHQCAGEMLRARRRGADAESLTNLGYRLRDASNRNQLELVRLFTAVRH